MKTNKFIVEATIAELSEAHNLLTKVYVDDLDNIYTAVYNVFKGYNQSIPDEVLELTQKLETLIGDSLSLATKKAKNLQELWNNN